MRRVLLTGATGFVGANLARRLLADGYELHLLVRHGSSPWRIEAIRDHVRLHTINLLDPAAAAGAVAAVRPDWVFHLAAHGAYSWQTDPHQIIQTNLSATVNLVEASLKAEVAVFVNTGSSSEYGAKPFAPSETSWLEPNSMYAVTKVAATHYCRHVAQRSAMRIATLRLYSVYGPYEEPNRLMPTLIEHGLRGALPPLVSPDIARDYIYADDVSDAYLLAATVEGQEPGAVYNLGTGVQTTLREVVELACDVLPITVAPAWGTLPGRPWDTTVWVADNRAIRNALGWGPRHSFGEGFRQMVAWFQANPQLLKRYQPTC
ncbi:MAG TPA: NAD-dependent epimerase/dehydratase family protein [Chloroflexaceae bacterium]|nr:NAD-dependent epimerase/dehydratase family protein [Chloroflexaceae bacterium]